MKSFCHFSKLIESQVIAGEIIKFLNENDLPLKYIRGQGFDGASNMSSSNVGVQARIKEHSPLATYIHCSGHSLNLVLSKSCTLPEIRNVLDRLKHCCHFFLSSPKRNGLLEKLIDKNVHSIHESKRKSLLDLCKTRWAERHGAYQHFYQAFLFIVEALEVIGYGMHHEEHNGL